MTAYTYSVMDNTMDLVHICVKCGILSNNRYNTKSICKHRFINPKYIHNDNVCKLCGSSDNKLHACASCNINVCERCGYYHKRVVCSYGCYIDSGGSFRHSLHHIIERCYDCGRQINIINEPSMKWPLCNGCRINCNICNTITDKNNKCKVCNVYICEKCKILDTCKKCVIKCYVCNNPCIDMYHCGNCNIILHKACAKKCADGSCNNLICTACCVDILHAYYGIIQMCEACTMANYKRCAECEKLIHKDIIYEEQDTHINKCIDCVLTCKGCENAYSPSALNNGHCSNCTHTCNICTRIIYDDEPEECDDCKCIICDDCATCCYLCEEIDDAVGNDDYVCHCMACLNTLQSGKHVCTKHTPQEYHTLKKTLQRNTVLELSISSKSGISKLPYTLIQEIFQWIDI